MLTDHEHYEELAALVISGQASAAELEEFNEHAQGCVDCGGEKSDLAALTHLLILTDPGKAASDDSLAGMTERFVARARAEGIPLSPYYVAKPVKQWPVRRALPWAAILAIGVTSSLLFLFRMGTFETAGNNSGLPPNPPALSLPSTAHDSVLAQEQASLSKQLHDAQVQVAQFKSTLESQRRDRETAEAKLAELNRQILIMERQLDEARRNESQRSQEIARLEVQLKTVSSERDNYRVDALLQKGDLLATRSKLNAVTEQLDEAQQLSGAANLAKDLIVARNLHIVDVHDNENGNKPRPFGRIFYAEDKKLVFFAYDLGDPIKVSAKVSFYVWGEKAGAKEVKNLGIFRADDRRDGRWVLTFDDARVLAQINKIFVTSESNDKKITKPNGNRILTAFLDDAPNHP